MKGLYKKISAIVLAGMVVLGGGALAGVKKADAVSFRGQAEVSIEQVAQEKLFRILEKSSNIEKINEAIEKNVKKNKGLRKRLLGQAEVFKNIEDFKKHINKKQKMHKVYIQEERMYYLIIFE